MAKASIGAQSVVVGLSVLCSAVYLISSRRQRRQRSSVPEKSLPEETHGHRSVEDILAEIENMDIHNIELDPHAMKYLATVEAYLKCFDQLTELYNDVDPSHKLAKYYLPDISRPIQQHSMNGDPVKDLDELYEVAEVMLPVFINKMESLVKQQQASSSTPTTSEEEKESSCGIEFKLPPWQHKLKRRQRASEKAKDDYSEKGPGPPESWLNDIVRGSVVFNDMDQLVEFLELIRNDDSIQIVKSKNRFRNPTISGYRDWQLQFLISNGGIEHTCELQLHLDAIKEAGVMLGSHDYYEFFRLYYAAGMMHATLEERLDDLRMTTGQGGSMNKEFLSNVTKNPLELSQMLRLADLFENHVHDYQLAMMITNAIRPSLQPRDWYTRMGNLFWQQGKSEDAVALYEEALVIQLQAVGPDHIDNAETFSSMADALVKQGRLEEAMVLYQKALDIAIKTFGPDHAAVATIYNNMANILTNQERFDDALTMYQQALGIRLKALGPDHALTAHTYASMASVLHHQNNLEESLAFYQMALVIFFKALGPDHADTAHTYANMATVLNKKGVSSGRMGTTSREHSRSKRRNSKELSKKTVSSLTEIMGEADPGAEENKAEDTDEEKAKLSRKPRQRRARRRRRNQFGGSSLEAISEDESEDDSEGLSESEPVGTPSLDSSFPDQPTPASPSTINLENMESRPQEEAIALPQNVVELPSQADMANSYMSMAVAQQNQGKLDEAMELYQKALETLLEVFGPDHAKTADAYFGIANVLKDQDKLEEAMVSFQKTLEIRLEVLGDDHIDTADTHSGIGEILCKQGKLDDALIECQKALDVQLIAAGAEDHSSTGNTFHTIAKILFHQDKLVEAMALCQHAVAIYWRTLGPGHPSTAKAKELMELAQHMMTEKCVKRKRKEILRPANQTD